MAMDRQATTAARSLKRKQESEKSDNHEARKVHVVEDPNKDGIALPKHRWSHDVFLSFRGKDTRKNFTDHLCTALEQAGIHTFRDDNGLRRGKNISTELLNAVQGSRISIVVFSKRYASSRWCLDELVKIVHCRNTIGHIVLPIYYHVKPSDVRKQKGSFAKAFIRHEKRFQTDMERVQRWRAALTEAADCSGWDLEGAANGYEARFIQMIVEQVRKMSSTWSLECYCGTMTYPRTAWTVKNPGRRFFGCSRYGERSYSCPFFKWFDPPMGARATKLIPRMSKKMKSLEEQLRKQRQNRKNKKTKKTNAKIEAVSV